MIFQTPRCDQCKMPIPDTTMNQMTGREEPASKYWLERGGMIMKTYCGAACSLKDHQERQTNGNN